MTTASISQRTRQDELGQFLTPEPIANFMASMFEPLPKVVRLLDAGAGAGSLTSAFMARLCDLNHGVQAVEATLYEIDPGILEDLSLTMQATQHACADYGIRFTYTIHTTDFIQEMSASVAGNLFGPPPPVFDAAIVNPPYRKIGNDSPERLALRLIGLETSNLYTGFVAIIQRLLVHGGQLVGITPRSFCNGPYFLPFREDLLGSMELRRLHVFDSRRAAFRQDNVLQENIVFHAVKGMNQPDEIVISSSSGVLGCASVEAVFPFSNIVHPGDAEMFIHIPSSPSHSTARAALGGLSASLASLGVTVSTGRVVDFRLKESLRKEPEHGTVPLIYPCHFNGGTIHWPRRDGRKPNAILDNDETRQWLVPSGTYLLTKRFTSKEERRRVVACLFDPLEVGSEWVGFENHVNYFHAGGQGLDRNLAVGLLMFLNSTVVDQYFRRFSGHTQVNATDLRALSYPDPATLLAMGSDVAALDLSQEQIDTHVAKYIHARK
jgi:adenine-specific DNA-methyltransferase